MCALALHDGVLPPTINYRDARPRVRPRLRARTRRARPRSTSPSRTRWVSAGTTAASSSAGQADGPRTGQGSTSGVPWREWRRWPRRSTHFCGPGRRPGRHGLPPLRGASAADDGRSRHVAAVRELADGGPARGRETFYPLHVLVCERCLARSARRARRAARRSSASTRTSPRSRLVGRARAAYVAADGERLRPRAGEPRRRARVQRRLPAAALPPEGHPRARASSRR